MNKLLQVVAIGLLIAIVIILYIEFLNWAMPVEEQEAIAARLQRREQVCLPRHTCEWVWVQQFRK